MLLNDLSKKNLIHPPKWLPANTHYLAIVGSESYGANLVGTSDQDLQGFCIPPKDDVFPHLRGEIAGFGRQHHRFSDWQEHHVKDGNGKEYDFAVYSIVRFCHLAMENNPNILDIISVPTNCIKHITPIGQLDTLLGRNAISLNEYDKEVHQLDEWIKNEYKVNRVFR